LTTPFPGFASIPQSHTAHAPLCGVLADFEYRGEPIPAEAWNNAIARSESGGTIEWKIEIKWQGSDYRPTDSLVGGGLLYPGPQGQTGGTPDVPFDATVYYFKIYGVQSCVQTSNAFQFYIPAWAGPNTPTAPTTLTPLSTNPPFNPPTTLPPTVVGQTPFSNKPNSLRLKALTSATPQPGDVACLGSSDSTKAELQRCDNPVIEFEKYNGAANTYYIKRGGRCLTITDQPTDISDPGHEYRNALKAEWRPCQADPAATGALLDDKFTMQAFGDWYLVRPTENRAGWNNPCLRFWGSGATNVIQFACEALGPDQQPQQYWAPNEKAGAGCAPNCPSSNPPDGAHLLREGDATPLERASDLACISSNGTSLTIATIGTTDCIDFVPRWSTGGWKLTQSTNISQCLGTNNRVDVILKDCDSATVWVDSITPGELSFPLTLTSITGSPNCLGGTTTPVLVTCDPNNLNAKWYDAKGHNGPATPIEAQGIMLAAHVAASTSENFNMTLRVLELPNGWTVMRYWANFQKSLPADKRGTEFWDASAQRAGDGTYSLTPVNEVANRWTTKFLTGDAGPIAANGGAYYEWAYRDLRESPEDLGFKLDEADALSAILFGGETTWKGDSDTFQDNLVIQTVLGITNEYPDQELRSSLQRGITQHFVNPLSFGFLCNHPRACERMRERLSAGDDIEESIITGHTFCLDHDSQCKNYDQVTAIIALVIFVTSIYAVPALNSKFQTFRQARATARALGTRVDIFAQSRAGRMGFKELGVTAEDALGKNTVDNQPFVDRIEANGARVVDTKTLDTGTTSKLTTPDSTYQTVKGHVDKLKLSYQRTGEETRRWKGNESTVNWSIVNQRVLEVVVPPTKWNQWIELWEGRQYGLSQGIQVKYVRYRYFSTGPLWEPVPINTSGSFFILSCPDTNSTC
jgi:hypothetical protein